MTRARDLLLAAGLALCLAQAVPAAAQEFEPRSGRSYVVRDMHGQLLERLQPSPGGYVRLSLSGQRLGRAVPEDGGQLAFYDTSGALIARARRDGRPPMALRLRALAVIRGVEGDSLGIVAAR
ncbi:hypothetical protein [Desertibaculum subflavum]|uniref:hypothetical protein n=1 Tax=Desertibaculum subflavum TaxID=2268458 RepID=UPI000E66BD65